MLHQRIFSCRLPGASVAAVVFLASGVSPSPAKAEKLLVPSGSSAMTCVAGEATGPTHQSGQPFRQPRRSLWAWATRRLTPVASELDQTTAFQQAACSRSKLDGCSALSPRQPDVSWASAQAHQGMPETLRLKAEPCVDTWYRLVARREGWVHFDVTRTDRRPEVRDPRWMLPLRMEVSCGTLHSKVEDTLLPIRRGSLGWIGAQIFC